MNNDLKVRIKYIGPLNDSLDAYISIYNILIKTRFT